MAEHVPPSLALSRRMLLKLAGRVGVGTVATGLLAACAGGAATAPAPLATAGATTASRAASTVAATSSAAPKPATSATGAIAQLTFSTWGAGGGAYSAEQKVVDAFNNVHPQIQAHVVEIPFNTYRDKLLAEFSGGDAPDTMAIDHD